MPQFGKEKTDEARVDMTSMVDITFLLLVFFMVTASFTLENTLSQNPVETDPSQTARDLERPEPDNDRIEVVIDQFNTYQLLHGDSGEIEAPSDQEMRVRLRDLIQTTGASQLWVTAHGSAWHEKVVTAWDAGRDNHIQNIVVRLSEKGF